MKNEDTSGIGSYSVENCTRSKRTQHSYPNNRDELAEQNTRTTTYRMESDSGAQMRQVKCYSSDHLFLLNWISLQDKRPSKQKVSTAQCPCGIALQPPLPLPHSRPVRAPIQQTKRGQNIYGLSVLALEQQHLDTACEI